MYDAGKEDYLRPSELIGLDWIGLIVYNYDVASVVMSITAKYRCKKKQK